MADSNITCSGLTATSGVGQLALRWAVTNPNAGGLPYLDLATVEVWAAASNDRAGAAKVGEGIDAFLHAGVPAGETRFYWVRARNVSTLYGDWHPLSATAGVAGTAGTAQPGPGSITEIELAPGAVTVIALADEAVEREKIAPAAVGGAQVGPQELEGLHLKFATIESAHIISLAATKIVASSLSAISANLGTVTAGTMYAVTINGGTINGTDFVGSTFTGGSITGATFTGGSIDAGGIKGVRIGTGNSGPPYIEMTGFGHALNAYDTSGTNVVTIGTSASSPVVRASRSAPSVFTASFTNASAGAVEAISPTWAFYASSGSYGPFTGAHSALWPIDEPLPEVGDLVMDDGVVFRNGVSNTLCLGKMAEAGRSAIGVFAAELPWTRDAAMPDDLGDDQIEALGRSFRLILVNALGEGQANVCDEGGPIAAGDLLIPSSTPGKAMRQADDLLRSITAARSRETVTFNAAGRAQAAVIYLAG